MMKPINLFVAQVFSLLSIISTNSILAEDINTLTGFKIHKPGMDWISGHFNDNNGNHIFMMTNGKNLDRGDAWVIKMNAYGADTLIRNFALEDTLSVFYTGYPTDHNTYIFIGQLTDDTIPSFCRYCYLWVVETDTLLQVINTRRYEIPQGYGSFGAMQGYPLSTGRFTMLGLLLAPGSSWYGNDLLLAQFDDHGDTVRTELISNPLNESFYFTILNPDNISFSAIISGLNINAEYERMIIDSSMNYQTTAFMENLNLQRPINFTWTSDTSIMIACTRFLSTDIAFDIRLLTAGISGNLWQNLILGTYYHFDYPAFSKAILPAGNNEYYFGGFLNAGAFEQPDTVVLWKVDENCNILGSLHYTCPENYFLHSLYLTPDGKVLVAAIINNISLPILNRDLSFFTIDPGVFTGSNHSVNQPLGNDFTVSPNPGNDKLEVCLVRKGPFSVTISDLSGKTILTAQSEDNCIELNGIRFHSGIYLIQIKDVNNNISIKKWIKSN